MRFKKYIIMAVVLVAAFYIFGLTVPADNCSVIGDCRQCWGRETTEVQSEFCPTAAPCNATAAQQQHNAVVDVLLCACSAAQQKQYADKSLNKEIETVAVLVTNSQISAQQLCDSPGILLTKRQYG